jgi:hypothetical protein
MSIVSGTVIKKIALKLCQILFSFSLFLTLARCLSRSAPCLDQSRSNCGQRTGQNEVKTSHFPTTSLRQYQCEQLSNARPD